jgi:2-dehydropantoate 2-reductase
MFLHFCGLNGRSCVKVIALGSGAVGGYCGARLAAAGHAVIIIARGEHLAAIRAHGLVLRSPLGDVTARGAATDTTDGLSPADLIILGIKTYDNDTVLPMLRPIVGPETVVLTFQNGIDSADQVAAVVGEAPVIAGAAYVATAKVAPGVIAQTGTHQRFVFGEVFDPPSDARPGRDDGQVSARVARVAEAFAAAGMQAEPVADARLPLWEKFIYLSPFAAFTAATRLPMGVLRTTPVLRDRFFAAIEEVERLARAEGVPLDSALRERIAQYVDSIGAGTRSSLLFDLSRGARRELESLVGGVVRRSHARGLDAPIAATLYALLQPFAQGTPSELTPIA